MITQLIFDRARQTPDRTAMIYNGRPLSYSLFAQRIAIARGYFARQGYFGPSHVVLAVRNLMDVWILSLALRSLGLTTAPVRLAVGLDKLLAALPNVRVVTSPDESWPRLTGVCTKLGVPLLSVSLAGEPDVGLEAPEPRQPLGGHILVTSGTTGGYKMVLISPAVDADFMRRKVDLVGLNQDSVYCIFDFGAWTEVGYTCAVSAWSVGGAVLIEQGHEEYHALSRPGITHAFLTPAMLEAVLAAPAGFRRNEAMQIAVGGGAMTQTQIDQVKARLTPHLFNWFGSTEVGAVAYTPLDTPDDRKWHLLVPDRAVEIVDESDRAVPTGEIGRLRVGTAGGPTSYLYDEAATRDFFKDGFFYPGDLAVMRADGRIALQGRATDVINVQGTKISPAPIEERLVVHLINLDRDVERLNRFLEINKHLDKIIRPPAFEGKYLDRSQLEMAGYISPHLSYSDPVLGCAYSHIELWKKAVRERMIITICEDDAILAEHFSDASVEFLAKLPSDWDIVLWGWNFDAFLWVEIPEGVRAMMRFDQDDLRKNIENFRNHVATHAPIRLRHGFR